MVGHKPHADIAVCFVDKIDQLSNYLEIVAVLDEYATQCSFKQIEARVKGSIYSDTYTF
jgi:hypothetical protein